MNNSLLKMDFTDADNRLSEEFKVLDSTAMTIHIDKTHKSTRATLTIRYDDILISKEQIQAKLSKVLENHSQRFCNNSRAH